MANVLTPFQLLELNVISAQDLAKVTGNMRTYAVAWVNPDRKLSTRVDSTGGVNPTWNDKFVFRVDDQFLYGDTSAVMIEIYALHWLRDIHVGTVRVIVGNLIPPAGPRNHQHHQHHLGMRFVALQVRRRTSGRPQGILNIGVALLDSSMRSMPLYTQLSSSAVGYRQIMGEGDPYQERHHQHNHHQNNSKGDPENQYLVPWIPMPELRRTKSDSSSLVAPAEVVEQKKTKKEKASSEVSASICSTNKRKGKVGSVVHNGSDLLGSLAKGKYGSEVGSIAKPVDGKKINFTSGGGVFITNSDPGPSASEVAAMTRNKGNHRVAVEEEGSEIVGDWGWGSSMEGLQSKMERWRADIPVAHDHDDFTSILTSDSAWSGKGKGARRQGHKSEGEGSFSCFSNICGLECAISCGGDGSPGGRRRRKGRQHKRSPSTYSASTFF